MCSDRPAPATGCATRCRTGSSAATRAAITRARKQIWFLLQLVGHDWDLNLRATDHPEFDAWRWNDYWVPLDVVVEFKRGVYEMALTELSRYLPRWATAAMRALTTATRYLRGGLHQRDHAGPPDMKAASDAAAGAGCAPMRPAGSPACQLTRPGAPFEPDPQTSLGAASANPRPWNPRSAVCWLCCWASHGAVRRSAHNGPAPRCRDWKELDAPPAPAVDVPPAAAHLTSPS